MSSECTSCPLSVGRHVQVLVSFALLLGSVLKGVRAREEQGPVKSLKCHFHMTEIPSLPFLVFFPTACGLFLSFICLLMVMVIGIYIRKKGTPTFHMTPSESYLAFGFW